MGDHIKGPFVDEGGVTHPVVLTKGEWLPGTGLGPVTHITGIMSSRDDHPQTGPIAVNSILDEVDDFSRTIEEGLRPVFASG